MTGKYVSLRSWITTYIIKQLNHHYTCIDYCVGGNDTSYSCLWMCDWTVQLSGDTKQH